jgi:hypothetical protein
MVLPGPRENLMQISQRRAGVENSEIHCRICSRTSSLETT